MSESISNISRWNNNLIENISNILNNSLTIPLDSSAFLDSLKNKYENQEKKIHVTQNEIEQLKFQIDSYLSLQWKDYKWLINIIDSYIKYEIQESIDRKEKWFFTPKEIIKKIQSLDLEDSWKISDVFIWESSYVMILIPQMHNPVMWNGLISKKEKNQIKIVQNNTDIILWKLFWNGITNIQLLEWLLHEDGNINTSYINNYTQENNIQVWLEQEMNRNEDIHTFWIENYTENMKSILIIGFEAIIKQFLWNPEKRQYINKMKGVEDAFFLNQENILILVDSFCREQMWIILTEEDYILARSIASKLFWNKKQDIKTDIKSINRYLDKSKTLYQSNAIDNRNKITIENIKKSKENTGTNSMILIMWAGHFMQDRWKNSEGEIIRPIQWHLKNKWISYISILPKPLTNSENYTVLNPKK